LKGYTLKFEPSGTYELTPIPEIEICEKGKYEVDCQYDYNELLFKCNHSGSTAHIDRGFRSYGIAFIYDDPDLGESIYFEKDKN
jgi:hypothetical protein